MVEAKKKRHNVYTFITSASPDTSVIGFIMDSAAVKRTAYKLLHSESTKSVDIDDDDIDELRVEPMILIQCIRVFNEVP